MDMAATSGADTEAVMVGDTAGVTATDTGMGIAADTAGDTGADLVAVMVEAMAVGLGVVMAMDSVAGTAEVAVNGSSPLLLLAVSFSLAISTEVIQSKNHCGS